MSLAEIDSLAIELINDVTALASDHIGNVIVQKLFENSGSAIRARGLSLLMTT